MHTTRTRTRLLQTTLWTVVLWTFWPTPATALLHRLSLEQMTVKSKLIVTGEVVDLVSYRAPLGRLGEVIFTDVRIRTDRVLKGDSPGDVVTVQVLGGEIGDRFQFCPESARYEKGEKVLLFLREYNGRLWNCGWIQGKYRLTDDKGTVRGDRRLPISSDTLLRDLESRLQLYSREPSVSTGGESTASGSPSRTTAPVLNRADNATGGSR